MPVATSINTTEGAAEATPQAAPQSCETVANEEKADMTLKAEKGSDAGAGSPLYGQQALITTVADLNSRCPPVSHLPLPTPAQLNQDSGPDVGTIRDEFLLEALTVPRDRA